MVEAFKDLYHKGMFHLYLDLKGDLNSAEKHAQSLESMPEHYRERLIQATKGELHRMWDKPLKDQVIEDPRELIKAPYTPLHNPLR